MGLLRSDITINLVLCRNDRLVPKELEMEFYNQIKERGINANLYEMATGHMVINEAPGPLFRILQERINP
ncbi:MAG: hypothetical protein HRT44_07775 [Bdellovibrionales bacterium]|nr:hypothetical protein [Bdellovibrionales bacterium]NQZ19137.1 hypothetical protein [Bdellovibrionales bacterium]